VKGTNQTKQFTGVLAVILRAIHILVDFTNISVDVGQLVRILGLRLISITHCLKP